MDEFQQESVDTLAITQKDLEALAHRGFGLAGEAGQTADIIKKIIRDKKGFATDQDIEAIKKRLGDVMYYTAVLAEYYDLKLSDIAKQNVQQSIDFKNNR